MNEKCPKCGARIRWIEFDGKRIPLDPYTIEERFVQLDGKWGRGDAGVSHYKTCQGIKRFRIGR